MTNSENRADLTVVLFAFYLQRSYSYREKGADLTLVSLHLREIRRYQYWNQYFFLTRRGVPADSVADPGSG
jgi:hypothetical protein